MVERVLQLGQPLRQERPLDLVLGEQQRFVEGQPGLVARGPAGQELGPRGRQIAVAGQLRVRTSAARARPGRPPGPTRNRQRPRGSAPRPATARPGPARRRAPRSRPSRWRPRIGASRVDRGDRRLQGVPTGRPDAAALSAPARRPRRSRPRSQRERSWSASSSESAVRADPGVAARIGEQDQREQPGDVGRRREAARAACRPGRAPARPGRGGPARPRPARCARW